MGREGGYRGYRGERVTGNGKRLRGGNGYRSGCGAGNVVGGSGSVVGGVVTGRGAGREWTVEEGRVSGITWTVENGGLRGECAGEWRGVG
jgi:hypothetical protein